MLAIAAIIGIVVVTDYLSTRPDKRPANPFEYSVEDYEAVDDSLLTYRETRQIRIGDQPIQAITYDNGRIYLVTDDHLLAVTAVGQEIMRVTVSPGTRCLALSENGMILLAYENHLVALNAHGEEIHRTEPLGGDALLTALAASDKHVFVADAGSRQVLVFNQDLEQTASFRGESGVSALHGFILPSLHFDLAVNGENELWVVNPGMHSIQNYSPDGRLRGHWGIPSFGADGFSGCCNPCYIRFLSDGRFVTSEKGIIRIKIHKESGEFASFVATPEKFINGKKAPALAVDENDNIWALDFDKNMIRLFEPK